MIGDQHAGKSSFIDRTEQSFSLTRIDKVQARGTQVQALAFPIGWWVSNEAVIIDPPGAFIRQDSPAGSLAGAPGASQVPPAAPARLWQHLLGWLVHNRSQRALNGMVLVVDLPALLQGTPEQRVALAHRLRTRLYEVSSQLGSRLPLYVVLSKFDLLDGFDQLYGAFRRPAGKTCWASPSSWIRSAPSMPGCRVWRSLPAVAQSAVRAGGGSTRYLGQCAAARGCSRCMPS